MKFYSFDEIRAAGDCAEFARDVYGAEVSRGRCNAAWRDGKNTESVSIDKDQWYDHAEKVGGGIIELAALKFDGDVQQAQAHLGQLYGLTSKMETGPQPKRPGRYEALLKEGYEEKKRYGYHNLDGNLVHFVSRLEHPEKGKQFLQGTPRGLAGSGAITP